MRDKRNPCRGSLQAVRETEKTSQDKGKKETGRLARHPYTNAQKVAYFGILSALALALSWAEQFVAPLLRLPLGAKPGLSNIAVMVGAASLGLPAGIAVAAAKAVFAGITRGPTAGLLSGAGGILSAVLVGALINTPRPAATPLLQKGAMGSSAAAFSKSGKSPLPQEGGGRRPGGAISEVGIGILGGVAHNLAQLGLAAALMGTPGVFWTAPQLIVFGVLAGAVTGSLVRMIRKAKFFG